MALQSGRVHDKTFTILEARALLPQLRELFEDMRLHRKTLIKLTRHVDRARAAAEYGGGTPYGAAYLEHASAFALAYEVSGSYRWAIVTLIIFFVAGGLLLRTVRVGEGIDAAGNQRPAVL